MGEGEDFEHVLRYEQLVEQLISKSETVYDRLQTLDDVMAIALEKAKEEASEHPLINGMRARINAALTPLDSLKAELSHLSEALGPYKDIAQSLDAHHLSLTHRTALVERAEEDLNDHRREVQKQEEMLREDKQAFSRTLETSAHNSQASQAETDSLRLRTRKAEEQLFQRESKTRSLGRQVADLQDEVRRLSTINSQLERDSGRSARTAERKVAQSKRDLHIAMDELDATEQQVATLREALLAEKRKGRQLQSTLQFQMSQSQRLSSSLPSHSGSRRVMSAAATRSSHHSAGPDMTEVKTKMREQETKIKQLLAQNKELLRHAKDKTVDSHVLRAQVSTNVSDRAELLYRVEKLTNENRYLQDELRKQAEQFVKHRKAERLRDEQKKWSRIKAISSAPTQRKSTTRLPSAKTRTIPVKNW